MPRFVNRILLPLGALVLVVFTLFVVNQVATIVQLADRVSPALGTAVLWGITALFVAALVWLVYTISQLPRTMVPPRSEDPAVVAAYVDRLRKRLAANPHLKGRSLASTEDLEAALSTLGEMADDVARRTAGQVFLATAVSQNGSLDALFVLSAQSRMVLEIARIYHQRPGLRQLFFLYSNVAAGALLARQLDDIDLSEYIQPVLSGVMTSTLSAVPGLQNLSGVLANSIVSGSANAYLTLRVGVLTRMYCGSLSLADPKAMRRSAIVEAARMLPSVAGEGAKQISAAIVRAGAGTAVRVSSEIMKGMRESAGAAWGRVRNVKRQRGAEPKA